LALIATSGVNYLISSTWVWMNIFYHQLHFCYLHY
jgi:hypothetical protein